MSRWSFSDELCDPAAGERLVVNGWTRPGFGMSSGLGWAGLAGGCRWRERSSVFVGLSDYKMQKDGQGILVGQASGCNLQSTGVYDLVGSKDVRSSTVVPLF